MTHSSATARRPVIMAAALVAAVGLVTGCNTANITTHSRTASAAAPLSCTITAERQGRMVNYQGHLQAREDLAGTYNLSVRGGGTNIRQGGYFAARNGETVLVGQANLSGTPSTYTAELSVTVNNETYNCD